MPKFSISNMLFGRNSNGLTHDYQQFLKKYPAYEATQLLDELREKDFQRLDEQDHTYLDFTGGQLYGKSLLEQHLSFLSQNVLGNPHSINPSSALSEWHIAETRKKVLQYFNAGEEYLCVFTANASASIKIVAESFPFSTDSQLLLTADNHNSINGIREYARKKGCKTTYSGLLDNLQLNESELEYHLSELKGKHKLFAYPAQSNVSGLKHDLSWIQKAHHQGWKVLLDAAAFVPSDRLDLQIHKPDFVALSFYKIFGYPTGLGALLIKKSTFDLLEKPSFAGGTITIVSVKGDGHYLEKQAARFEDGTVNYLEIPAIKNGLEYIESIGIELINRRVHLLTSYLLSELRQLKHSNGQQLIHVYGPESMDQRGGTLVMNFYDVEGQLYDFQQIEAEAFKENISIRTGCFCNPGIDETNHRLDRDKLLQYFRLEGEKNYFDLIRYLGKKRGAVRISIGFITNYKDIEKFLKFCRTYLNKRMKAV